MHNEKKTIQVEREKLTDLYFSEIYPFKPNISNKSEPTVGDFFQRLQSWVEKRNGNYKNELQASLSDCKTGQKLFQPIISDNKTIDTTSHRQEKTLFEFLYEEHKLKPEKRKDYELDSTKEIIKNSNLKLTTKKTDQLNSLLKEDCFECLFELIDHNDDNVVECSESFTKNMEDKLDKNIINIIEPIFTELKEHQESLKKEEFFMALDELFKDLSVAQKRELLNWYVEKKRINSPSKKRTLVDSSNFTYNPYISKNSQHLYSNSKRYSKDFFNRNIELLHSREKYIKEKSIERVQIELNGKYNNLI